MLMSYLVFFFGLFLVIQSATLATRYAGRLSESFRLSKYVVGFIIVAFVSILPEAFISLNSALSGVPSFGLGTLFGSNVADLTLIFFILTAFSGRGIKVESRMLKEVKLYPIFLLLPLILGLDGAYSRLEGIFLITLGLVFYYLVFRQNTGTYTMTTSTRGRGKNFILLLVSLITMLWGAHLTVEAATTIAVAWQVSPILIGMLIVGLGTTMPELFFSLKTMKKTDDALAVGDILGTVLADATIVVGMLAVVSPFTFSVRLIYLTGLFMVTASFLLLSCLKTKRTLSKKEGWWLLIFWLVYAVVEFYIGAH